MLGDYRVGTNVNWSLWSNGLSDTAAMVNGVITCTPNFNYGEVGFRFNNVQNYVGKTLMFTLRVSTAKTGGNDSLKGRMYLYNGSTQVNARNGSTVTFRKDSTRDSR
ncbi:hypothetical protein [Bacillus sp. UNC41MFS5]|uniref:hypothetical protein n=1 Tax=Bacillus sp. UNC41MFS5 TaxID=1449046 RepID=UPI00047E5574|nr:hypothetical protein [Bacillus sp. UNC41MFS5]